MASVDIDFDRIDPERETKHAYFIIFEEGFDEVSCFVPKSQVEVDEKRKVVTMPEWMATEKGLV
jgi:enhancing lycopene biosynthesis protein 2